MASDQIDRRLAAILAADVAGYSRLTERNEEATIRALKSHRAELIDPKIAEHRGRIANTAGDSVIAEFVSVVDAVRCAVDIQRGMAARNAGVPEDERMLFRIGINVGDIIRQGQDIFGDGVNVAARLENIAPPGGIMVSQAVEDQVRDKLSFSFVNLGEQHVKNISRPVTVAQVRFDESGAAVPTPGAGRQALRFLRRYRTPIAAAALAAAVVVAGLWFWICPGCSERMSVAQVVGQHDESVTAVAVSADGKLALSGSSDDKVKLWDLANRAQAGLIHTFDKTAAPLSREGDVSAVGFSPDGSRIALAGADEHLYVLDSGAKKVLFDLIPNPSGKNVNSIAFSPDSRFVLAAYDDFHIRLWDAAGGKLVRTYEANRRLRKPVKAAQFGPDGAWFVAASEDGMLRIWDRDSANPRAEWRAHTQMDGALAVSRDGKWILSGSYFGIARVWEAASQKPVKDLTHDPTFIQAAAFSPDGRYAAIGGGLPRSGYLAVFRTDTWSAVRKIEGGGQINSLAFAPDGSFLLAGLRDKTLRLIGMAR